MNIQKPGKSFNFENLSLETPVSIQGGSWITKVLNNGEKLYIQTNECLTKQGFVNTGKKTHVDLLFDQKDSDFIEWTERLEDKMIELIHKKSDVWFENSLDKSDIENAFSPLIRSFRSGKNYLLRVNISNKLLNDHVKIFSQNEEPVNMESINSETKIVSILEVNGIKFTSKNFQIEILLRQMMVLENKPIFENCLIKLNNSKKTDELLETINQDDTNDLEEKSNKLKENEVKDETLEQHVEEQHVEQQPVEQQHVEQQHVEQQPVEQQPVEQQPVEEQPVEEQPVEQQPVEEQPVEEQPVEEQPVEKEKNEIVKSEILENKNLEKMDNDDTLVEFDITEDLNNLEKVHLKNPKEVYYEIYKEAKSKAKQAKLYALNAIFEANQIKKTYNLDDFIESSDDETSEFN